MDGDAWQFCEGSRVDVAAGGVQCVAQAAGSSVSESCSYRA